MMIIVSESNPDWKRKKIIIHFLLIRARLVAGHTNIKYDERSKVAAARRSGEGESQWPAVNFPAAGGMGKYYTHNTPVLW